MIKNIFLTLTFTAMKSDAQIQQDVLAQIKWDPLLTGADIKITVSMGVVTLSGQVDTYQKKLDAEKEARKVAGVRAIAENIQVGTSSFHQKSDTEIAQSVLLALNWHTSIPEEKIKIKVENGTVTLEGEVEWAYQRESAREIIASLEGVRSVINLLTLSYKVTPKDLKQKIHAAFHRSASLDASKIQVVVLENEVILKGKVRSIAEKEDAEKVAWAAPGILKVDNKLELLELEEEPYYSF
jgi:osmotically-inducible protein OsmY